MAQQVNAIMTPAPIAIRPGQRVTDAARTMRGHGIGTVLVVEDSALVGIITDRDIVVRTIAEGRDPAAMAADEICSRDLVTVRPDEDAEAVVARMRERGVRRVPVVSEGSPVGIVSIGDLAVEHDSCSALADVSAQPPNT